MKNIYQNMKSIKSLKDYRILSTTKWNGAITKTWYKLWWHIWKPNMCQYRKQRPSSQPPIPRARPPLNTCSHIATQYQSHYHPYRILNIDVSVKLSQQHSSCVDMTIQASQHKSRVSILPTYNINISDHHTHPIHCHALHHHRTTTTSTTANMSDPNTHI